MSYIKNSFMRYIAGHRRNIFVRGLNKFAETVYRGFRNLNYDLNTNGERWVMERVGKMKPRVVFDVGANVGKWSISFAQISPSTEIYCFEIVPETGEILKRNTSPFPNIHVETYGLGETKKEVKVKYFPQMSGLSTLLDYPHPYEFKMIKGEIKRGDDVMMEKGIEEIDLLKIDVEGEELMVLKGFENSLSQGRIKIIQFEYGKANILSRTFLKDFYDLLIPYGFVIGKIYPRYVEFKDYELDDEDFLGPNYLAVMKTSPYMDLFFK